MSFRLLSLQKLVAADFVPVFKEIPGKVMLKETMSTGQVQQIAIMTICKGRLTLDCKLASRSSMASPPTSICKHELHRSPANSGKQKISQLLARVMVPGIQMKKGTKVNGNRKPGRWKLPDASDGKMEVEFLASLTSTSPVPAKPLQPSSVGFSSSAISAVSMNAAATNALGVPASSSQPADLPAKPGIIPESSTNHTRSNRGVSPLTLAAFVEIDNVNMC